jgi:hypothetical protein
LRLEFVFMVPSWVNHVRSLPLAPDLSIKTELERSDTLFASKKLGSPL